MVRYSITQSGVSIYWLINILVKYWPIVCNRNLLHRHIEIFINTHCVLGLHICLVRAFCFLLSLCLDFNCGGPVANDRRYYVYKSFNNRPTSCIHCPYYIIILYMHVYLVMRRDLRLLCWISWQFERDNWEKRRWNWSVCTQYLIVVNEGWLLGFGQAHHILRCI